ncbi:MAG: redoxin domain-containing protein [Phycisphaerales bacterium]
MPLTPRNNPIQPGEPAPDFTLKDQTINDWSLADAVKKGDVVLCFYPLDFSPVCSTEMKCITDDFAKFADKGATVVGISCDSFFTHKAWAEHLGLQQTLLADMHREVCKAYGFYFPDLNVSSRGTVVIAQSDDGQGTVKWVQAREIPQAMDLNTILAGLS